MPSPDLKPSISVSSWFSVASRSSFPLEYRPLRARPTASISSDACHCHVAATYHAFHTSQYSIGLVLRPVP